MWTRAELKARAKAAMKPFYWWGVLACIIAGILGAETGSGSAGASASTGSQASSMYSDAAGSSGGAVINEQNMAVMLGMLVIVLVVGVVVTLFSIFVSDVVRVGKNRYFMESGSQGQSAGIGRLFFAFGDGHYLNVVKTMFLKGFYQFLWTLLLVIPGIYKHYEYYMIPYLLADNPDMDHREAFALSKRLMDGNKFATFVLELSFIGWYVLGVFVCCIGGIFVNPYYEMTFVELYWTLRDQILGPQPTTGGPANDQTVYTDTNFQAL